MQRPLSTKKIPTPHAPASSIAVLIGAAHAAPPFDTHRGDQTVVAWTAWHASTAIAASARTASSPGKYFGSDVPTVAETLSA